MTHLGAWTADDVYEPREITGLMPEPEQGVVELDAAGFFAYLTRREYYMRHEYKPFDGGALGPAWTYAVKV